MFLGTGELLCVVDRHGKTHSWCVQVGFYHAGLDPKMAWNTSEMDGHVWYYRNFGNLWCGSKSAPETSAPGERVFKMPHPLVSPPPCPSKKGGERRDAAALPSAETFCRLLRVSGCNWSSAWDAETGRGESARQRSRCACWGAAAKARCLPASACRLRAGRRRDSNPQCQCGHSAILQAHSCSRTNAGGRQGI